MKIANQLSIAWIQKEERSRNQLVVVHSRSITPSDAEEAWQKNERWQTYRRLYPDCFSG